MNRRVNALTLKEKLEVLNDWKKNSDKRDLCTKYKINKSTINRIIRSEEKIRLIAVTGKNLNRKRQRNGLHGKVEKALEVWIKEIKEENATLTQTMILDKAKEFAVKLNEDFNPGLSWLYRWCKRENIKIGRSNAKPNENNKTEDLETQNILPNILNDYDSDCIFNANECGLYYKAVPDLFSGKEENLKKHHIRSARFTLLFICNATGSYKKIFVIGKKKITAIRNLKIPLPYFVSKNALLTISLWNTILNTLDIELRNTNQKIVLFVNKSSCHQILTEFKNIKVHYLESKSTILIQPLDYGIIKAFKVQYREQMVKKQLCAFERGQSLRQFLISFSAMNALFLIKRSWSLIKTETIMKCFEKSGFIAHERMDQSEIDKNSILKLIKHKMDYIHIDDHIKCTETVPKIKLKRQEDDPLQLSSTGSTSDDGISDDGAEEDDGITNSDVDSDQMEKDNQEVILNWPNANAALLAIETLQNFCLINNIESDSLEQIEKSICEQLIKQAKHNKFPEIF